ncbi:MFS transporter [Luteibacter aegosomaticola]|uniref:MFS transporter n=1 Tax=Luteibacter aegosomaticola TaxID=2911538 RepID=UPI001FF74568|nr:MFS transporter [Luteibacter aegosomaticola]UPG90182.1 MFS transporter [Luteibacter aegosomaticola]
MSSAAPALDPGTPPVRAPHVGLVILALAVGGFAIGTTEFASMSMLPLFAQGLGIDAPTAGHAISAYALGVVVGAPIITVLGARMPRRRLLLLLMAMFTVFNGLTGLSPNYHWMLVFRFLAGLPHGAYFGVAALVASSLVPANRRTRAVGQMFLGLTVATIAGVPLASWLGQLVGWRWSFALVAVLGVATMSAVLAFAPNTPANPNASPLRELSALKRSQVWITLGIGAIGFGGMFAVYTYLADILLNVTHMPLSSVPWIMGVFGVGMTLGNMVVPVFADRALMRTAGALLVWALIILAIFPFTAGNVWTLGISVFFIGISGALGTVLQTRLMDVAGDAQALAAALNHSAFNTANALGPFLGGLAISQGYGWTSPGWVGSGLALGGLLLWGVSVAVERNSESQEAAQAC